MKLLNAFKVTSQGSTAFNLRLIELVAPALHQIAVFLFQLEEKLHEPETTGGLDIGDIVRWERPAGILPDFLYRYEPWPTLFIHPAFTAHEQFPNGVADIVGFWAEDRVLGGVALFDRSQSWGDENEPNVYFQSCRTQMTYRIWQLMDNQQSSLVGYLLSDHPTSEICPLPILHSRDNKIRVDAGDVIEAHKIYRNLWERAPFQPHPRIGRGPCVQNPIDYPDMEDPDEEVARLNRM